MKKRRVVVTGMGIKSSIGNDLKTYWNSLKNGIHGIRPIEFIDTKDLEVKVASYDYDFDPLSYFDKKTIRKTDRFCQMALAASKDALDGQNLLSIHDPFRVGVIFSSGIGGIGTVEKEHSKWLEKGPGRVSVFLIPMMISNIAAGMISIDAGFRGDNMDITTACTSSTHAIGEAFRKIRDGYLDACVAGGSEAGISGLTIAGFSNMKALTKASDPDRASIPFDKQRSGFVIGEGAAALVLEELEFAKARKARIYAEILGYGATADAYHITSPDPTAKGPAKCFLNAIQDAGVTPSDIDYINAHGTSTGPNDRIETMATKIVFGAHAYDLMISSTKSMTGHMLGAAGAAEAVATILALKFGIVPPTIGYLHKDEECDLDYVTEGAREKPIKYALSNSLGFGGHNATICFKKFED